MFCIYFVHTQVKCQVEEKRNEAYAVFNAVQYKSQVLQGVNYVIKVIKTVILCMLGIINERK